MSEDQEMSSGQPDEVTSGATGEMQQSTSGADSVKYDTYKKVLGEKKAVDAKLAEMSARLEQMELEKASAEGNKDELLVKYQEHNRQLQTRIKEQEQKYAYATLGAQVRTEAAKMGCQDPESLMKLMDLSSIPVDPTTYSADSDSVRMMLEDQRKSRPFFFGKPAPTVHDVSGSNSIKQAPTVDFNSMSREELDTYLAKNADKLK